MARPFDHKLFRNPLTVAAASRRPLPDDGGLPDLAGAATSEVLETRRLPRLTIAGKKSPPVAEALLQLNQRLARVHAAVSQGEPVYEVLLVNEGNGVAMVAAALRGAQRTFHSADSNELEAIALKPKLLLAGEPALVAGSYTFHAVVVPPVASVPRYTARLLMRYQAIGGPIILLGQSPQLLDGKPNTTMARFFDTLPRVSPRGLAPLLRVMAAPRVRVYGPDEDDRLNLRMALYTLGKGQALLHIANCDPERTFNGDVIAAGRYSSATVLDPVSGDLVPLRTKPLEGDARGALLFQLPFASWQDHLVLLSPTPTASDQTPVSLLPLPVSERAELLPEAWTAEPIDKAGTICYRALIPKLSGKTWYVELGQLDRAVAVMTIDGRPAGRFMMEPFEAPVPSWARKGQQLEIIVSPLPSAPAPDVTPIRFIKR